MTHLTRTTLAALACAAVTLAAAASALADDPQFKPNARDQATARKAVVQMSDFVPGSGWSKGPSDSGQSAATGRCKLDPKQSDLVETGDATSTFRYRIPIVAVVSGATVYRTSRMAQLSWQRARPSLQGFLRCIVGTSLPPNAKVVSVKPTPFPRIGSFGGAYRTTFEVSSGGTSVRLVTDVAVFGSGRVLFMLMQLSPEASAAAAKQAEVRLATSMKARADGLVA